MADLVPAVTAALAPRWSLATGPTRRVRTTVLDTFDWRLHRKGVTAMVTGSPTGPRTLSVTAAGSAAPATAASTAAATAAATAQATLDAEPERRLLLADVPAGEARDRLAVLLDVRALLPLASATTSVRELRVLDDEEKTVVRLLADGERVTVQPVKGYMSAARAVTQALTAAGVALDDGDTAARLLHGAGLTPGALPGAVDPVPTPQTPAPTAVASVLRAFLDQLEANVPGAVDDLDPEFVHDLRIAVRRSRSALKLAGDVLPRAAAQRAARELKWLGDVTTPIRDLDVHLLDLPSLAARLEAFPPSALDAFADHLARHRVGEQRTMARALTSARTTRFLAWWRTTLDALVDTDPDEQPVGALAAARVARADRRVVKLGRAITPDSPADDLHTLRKRAKELRYTVDLFTAVLPAAHVKALVTELKALQDVLGAFQDSEVQRDALRTAAAAMVAEQSARRPLPVDTLLALGELAGHLKADQDDARAHFDERFARFTRPGVRRHVAALSEGAS